MIHCCVHCHDRKALCLLDNRAVAFLGVIIFTQIKKQTISAKKLNRAYDFYASEPKLNILSVV